MRIATVVGTRPQLIKAAALQPALRARHDEIFIDTGQHYDEAMAGVFFAELGLPRPDHSLGVAGGGHSDQAGRMLVALEPLLARMRPDAVLIFGDTNSTLAGALAAAKLGIPVAHVEAGLRSFDRAMPEEINRVVADHLARWSFAPTPTAVANLAAEGIRDGVLLVGDLMQDLVARLVDQIRDPGVVAGLPIRDIPKAAPARPGKAAAGPVRKVVRAVAGGADEAATATPPPARAPLAAGEYLFATIHRAENRDPAALVRWVALLDAVATKARPVVLALHPGTLMALRTARVRVGPNVRLIEPLGYRSSIAIQLHAAAVLTDSGGVQREAAWLRVPCLVLRTTTEWVETVADSDGRTVVVGLDQARALAELDRLAPRDRAVQLAAERAATVEIPEAGAADRISEYLAGAQLP